MTDTDITSRVAEERARLRTLGQYITHDERERMTWALDTIETLQRERDEARSDWVELHDTVDEHHPGLLAESAHEVVSKYRHERMIGELALVIEALQEQVQAIQGAPSHSPSAANTINHLVGQILLLEEARRKAAARVADLEQAIREEMGEMACTNE